MNKSKHFAAAINPPVGSRKLPYLQIKTIQTMNFNPYYKISFNKPRQKLGMFDIYSCKVCLAPTFASAFFANALLGFLFLFFFIKSSAC